MIKAMVIYLFFIVGCSFAFADDGIEGIRAGSTEAQVKDQFYRRCDWSEKRDYEGATGEYIQEWKCFGDIKNGYALTLKMASDSQTNPLKVASISFNKKDTEGRLFTNHGITIGDSFKRVKSAYAGENNFKVTENSNPFNVTFSEQECFASMETYCDKQITYSFKKINKDYFVDSIFIGPLGE